MIVLSLLCCCAAVLVLLYYRKRVRHLKREIAHVHYTASPHSQPGNIIITKAGFKQYEYDRTIRTLYSYATTALSHRELF